MIDKINIASYSNQLIEDASYGIMIVDDQAKVQYFNQKLSRYFDDFVEPSFERYGNIFNCEIVYGNKTLCGTDKICRNCELKKAFAKVKASNEAMENLMYERVYMQNGNAILKWFQVSISPMTSNQENLFVFTFNDMTEHMNYTNALELESTMDYYRNELWKFKFHESVIQWLSSKAYERDATYLVHIESEMLEENSVSFLERIHLLKENIDLVCKISGKEYLLYFPRSKEVEINKFLKLLSNNHVIKSKMAKLILVDEIIDEINEESNMHIVYFKALSSFLASAEIYQEIVLK